MFTGIIEEVGIVKRIERGAAGARLVVGCHSVLGGARNGSSIAVNGACLTAVAIRPRSFSADLAPETLARTNLGDLAAGSLVNLERPLGAKDRLSGHVVQGHIDGTAELVAIESLGEDNWWLKARVPPELDRYLVFKGSVAIDGISLTVASIASGLLGVTIVPHTWTHTNLQARNPGDRVNVETDILAKYVEKLTAGMSLSPARRRRAK